MKQAKACSKLTLAEMVLIEIVFTFGYALMMPNKRSQKYKNNFYERSEMPKAFELWLVARVNVHFNYKIYFVIKIHGDTTANFILCC